MSEVVNAQGIDSDTAVSGDTGLRQSTVSWVQVLAQSIANIAPTAGVAVLISIVFSQAGYGGWLSWALGAVAMLAVAYCVALLTRRFVTTGSLYELVSRSVGAGPGFVTGWVQFFGAMIGMVPIIVGFGLYAGIFLSFFGLPGTSVGVQLVLYLIAIVLPGYFAYRDIRLSTTLLLILEVVSMAAIVLLLILVLARHGTFFDSKQFAFSGFSFPGILAGIVTVAYALGGFESASVLGVESQQARRSVPRAVVGSLVVVALFVVFVAYSQALGYEGLKGSLATTDTPLDDLAAGYGLGIFQYIVTAGIILSLFANIIANFNGISRIIFTMARNGFLPASLGRVHPKSQTPLAAIVTFGAVTLVLLVLGLFVLRLGPLALIGLLGGLSGFGSLLAYFFVTLAVPIYLFRNRLKTALPVIIAGFGLLVTIGVFVATIYPPPAPPANLFPIVFLIYLVLVVVLYFALKSRRPRASKTREQANSVESDNRDD